MKSYRYLENSLVVSYKDRHASTFDSATPPLGMHLREMKTYVLGELHGNIHEALFSHIVAPN